MASISNLPIAANPNRLYSPITRPSSLPYKHGSIIVFAYYHHQIRKARVGEGQVKRGTRKLDTTMIAERLDNDKHQYV